MAKKLQASGYYTNKQGKLVVSLQVLSFKEDETFIAFCPHLDISGYGTSESKSIESLDYNLEEFFDYTTKKGTFIKVMRELGWNVRKIVKNKKIEAPKLSDLIVKNEYLSDIVNNNIFKTLKKEIQIPQGA